MPRGTYALRDPLSGAPLALERFSSASSPGGWHYTAEVFDPTGSVPLGSVDLACDATWRQVRVELVSGGWRLRGGVTGRDAVWARSAVETEPGSQIPDVEQVQRAAAFTGRSPGFAVAVARLLRLDEGARARLTAVAVTQPALGARAITEGWALVEVTEHPTEAAPLRVERYEVADLDTGERSVLHLTGDVVLEGPGTELVDLDGPPGGV